MNKEKLRESIAIACGWKCDNKGGWKRWYHPEGRPFGNSPSGLPRYLSERDAAVESVIELCDTEEKQEAFLNEIHFSVFPTRELLPISTVQIEFMLFTATPLQICTALAKALSLEVEE